jgi:hypothetical protein
MKLPPLPMSFPSLPLPRVDRALKRLVLRAKDLYSTARPQQDAGVAPPAAGERMEKGFCACRHRFR